MILLVRDFILPAAYAILPPEMHSPKATAHLLAIGLQESAFVARTQGGGGPAKGLFQFEKAGVRGVSTHVSTRTVLRMALATLQYTESGGQTAHLHAILEHNDVLACIFARLLLWTVPSPLPERDESEIAFFQYLDAWRPGAWTRGTDTKRAALRRQWDANYARAWDLVQPRDT